MRCYSFLARGIFYFIYLFLFYLFLYIYIILYYISFYIYNYSYCAIIKAGFVERYDTVVRNDACVMRCRWGWKERMVERINMKQRNVIELTCIYIYAYLFHFYLYIYVFIHICIYTYIIAFFFNLSSAPMRCRHLLNQQQFFSSAWTI